DLDRVDRLPPGAREEVLLAAARARQDRVDVERARGLADDVDDRPVELQGTRDAALPELAQVDLPRRLRGRDHRRAAARIRDREPGDVDRRPSAHAKRGGIDAGLAAEHLADAR